MYTSGPRGSLSSAVCHRPGGASRETRHPRPTPDGPPVLRRPRAGARAARTKSDHTTSVVTSLLTHHNSSRGTHTSHHMRTTRAAAPAGPRLGDARAVRCIEYTTSSSSCLAYRQSPSAATPTHIANVSSSSTESSISASSRGYSRIRADSAASPRHGRRVDCRQHPSHRRLPKPR